MFGKRNLRLDPVSPEEAMENIRKHEAAWRKGSEKVADPVDYGYVESEGLSSMEYGELFEREPYSGRRESLSSPLGNQELDPLVRGNSK
jgi:hypothetical protein